MLFMTAMTVWAMQINLTSFWQDQNILLLTIGSLILILQIWMLIEGLRILIQLHTKSPQP
jgi:hypothetical protein